MGNLEELQIDKFTLATLVLGTFIRPRLGVSGEGVFLVLTGLAGISVILTLLIKKPNIPATRIQWVMVGVATSSITIILITVLEIFFRGTWSVVAYNRIGIVFGLLARELTFTALVEEILFRGFLWGYLKRSGWDDNKTFWVQGLLFWLMHLGKIFSPFTFFIAIPLFTILFSKIRLHSRQLFPSIASHLLVNVISALLNMATY